MDAVPVNLAYWEVFQAAMVGVSRRIDNLRKRNVSEVYGQPAEPWWTDINGACGELAVARWLNVFWSGQLGNYRARDVGPLQVRTARRDTGRLVLHDRDADDHVFVLVTGEAPDYTLRGWIVAADGKVPEYWEDPSTGRPAYFVPQDALRPMAELKHVLA